MRQDVGERSGPMTGEGLDATMAREGGCTSVATSDEDALFSHLEELVGRLPAMQELAARLSRARAARVAMDCAHELEVRRRSLAEEDRLLDAERGALRAAREAGDELEADRHQRATLYYGQRRGLRVGPVASGEAALAKALSDGGFETVEEARAGLMAEDELGAGERSLADYQADYAATLAACEEIESSRG